MKKIRIKADVFATDATGNPAVVMAANSMHEESADALRQVALGNAEVVEVADEAPASDEAEAEQTPARQPRRARA